MESTAQKNKEKRNPVGKVETNAVLLYEDSRGLSSRNTDNGGRHSAESFYQGNL